MSGRATAPPPRAPCRPRATVSASGSAATDASGPSPVASTVSREAAASAAAWMAAMAASRSSGASTSASAVASASTTASARVTSTSASATTSAVASTSASTAVSTYRPRLCLDASTSAVSTTVSLDGGSRRRLGDAETRLLEERGDGVVVEILERRGLRQARRPGGEDPRVLLAQEIVEEGAHLALEGRDAAADLLDLVLDDRRVPLELTLELLAPGRDPSLGLLADPGDLGLGPFLDDGDVVVGAASELRGTRRGTGMDLLDGAGALGAVLVERRGARLLGRRLHGPRQVRQELRRRRVGAAGTGSGAAECSGPLAGSGVGETTAAGCCAVSGARIVTSSSSCARTLSPVASWSLVSPGPGVGAAAVSLSTIGAATESSSAEFGRRLPGGRPVRAPRKAEPGSGIGGCHAAQSPAARSVRASLTPAADARRSERCGGVDWWYQRAPPVVPAGSHR